MKSERKERKREISRVIIISFLSVHVVSLLVLLIREKNNSLPLTCVVQSNMIVKGMKETSILHLFLEFLSPGKRTRVDGSFSTLFSVQENEHRKDIRAKKTLRKEEAS